METHPKKPIQFVLDAGGNINVIGAPDELSASERAERKVVSAKCGHVKRRLLRGEPLQGKLLTFALDAIADDGIAAKLQAGEKLSDYELHLMVDVYLLHRRLVS